MKFPYLRFPAAILSTLRALTLAAFLLSQNFQPVSAQTPPGDIRFETLSVEDGLSQSTVRAILQDSQGFLWFGTDDGLNKYDGYTFTIYKHDSENRESLADSSITALYQDRDGRLWVGTASGLDRFERKTETFQHLLNGQPVSAILADASGNLWVGITDGGLRQINPDGGLAGEYHHNSKNAESLVSDQVTALAVEPSGGVWIGTSEGLDFLDPATGKYQHYQSDPASPDSLSDNRVQSLIVDRLGVLWIGTEAGGLNRLDQASRRFTRYESRVSNPYTLTSNFVRSIYEDKAGHLWIGGRKGLHRFYELDEYFTRYQHDPSNRYSLSNDYILSMYEDRSGVLWIGTYGGGLSKYVQSSDRFSLYQHRPGIPNSLSNDIVNAIYEDQDGVVWVGTLDGGLNRLDTEANSFVSYLNNPSDPASLSSNDVRAIHEDRYGNLWVGTFGGGLNLFDRNSYRFIRYLNNLSDPTSLSDNRVLDVHEDRKGNLWIGTRAGGLNLMDRSTGRFTHFQHSLNDPASLAGDYVRTIYEDHLGRLWVGTNSGISVRDPETGRFKLYQNSRSNPRSLSDNRVLSILETNDNVIWIGTLMGGLNRFDPVTQDFQHYTQKQGLPGDTVYGILADRSGYLWLSTNKGLSRFNPLDETFRNYERQDGLQSYEYNPGAYFQNSRGRMYFGGVQGFNAFDPSQVKDNEIAPPVVITAFKKFNLTERKDISVAERIELNYQDSFISFEFAALDYSAPEKNQYAYKLEGFDKDWVYSGTRRYTSYTNLRGGNYVFRVIGSNQDGIWNEIGASVAIVVIPPLWERWWFIGTLGMILLGSAIGGYRLRVVRIQEQNRALEAQIRERTQEVERRREVAEGLREILTILNSNRSLKDSLDSIISQIVRLMGARAVVIFRTSEEGYPLIVAHNLSGAAADNHPDKKSAQVETLPGWITLPVMQGERLNMANLLVQRITHPDLDESRIAHYGALLAVPLVVGDKPDGGLIILYGQPHAFTEEDYRLISSFANHAALAIANALLRSQSEEIAVSAERSRLARDLHDAVTQTLFATSLIAEVLPRLWERSPEAGKQKINEIRELTRGALAEMRTLLMELRPTALEDVPLPDLIQQLSEAFTGRARVPVKLEMERPFELPSNVKIVFYRIAQESLNNIQKHSRASQVKICLHEENSHVRMTIFDNGVGFDLARKLPDHFGLGIMEERAQSVRAQFELDSQPGKGTQVCVTWHKD